MQKWALDRVEDEKREEWLMMLTAPLPGQRKRPQRASDISEWEEGESFMALHTGGAR